MKIFRNSVRIKPKMKLAISLASVLTLATVGGVATHASLSDTGASQINGGAGTMSYVLTGDVVSIGTNFSLSRRLQVNSSYTGTTTIQNTGTIPLKYTAALSGYDSGPEYLVFLVDVKIGATLVYSGPLDAFAISEQTVGVDKTQQITITTSVPLTDELKANPGAGIFDYINFTFTN